MIDMARQEVGVSQKVFDILPPYPKEEPRTYHHHNSDKTKKEKVKTQHNFLIFIFGLFFIVVLFGLVKLENFNGSGLTIKTSSTKTDDTSKASNQFELFDNQGQSNLTNTSQPTSVRLLDGATKTDSAGVAKNLLLKNNYIIEKQDKASNIYTQTMIYYKKGNITLGQKAADALKPNFTPLIQESSGGESTYDLLIIVGDK